MRTVAHILSVSAGVGLCGRRKRPVCWRIYSRSECRDWRVHGGQTWPPTQPERSAVNVRVSDSSRVGQKMLVGASVIGVGWGEETCSGSGLTPVKHGEQLMNDASLRMFCCVEPEINHADLLGYGRGDQFDVKSAVPRRLQTAPFAHVGKESWISGAVRRETGTKSRMSCVITCSNIWSRCLCVKIDVLQSETIQSERSATDVCRLQVMIWIQNHPSRKFISH